MRENSARHAAIAAALLLVAAALAPAADANTYRMKFAEIVDQSGFEAPMVAARIAIPADWQSQSDVKWQINSGCTAMPVLMRFLAVSPDGRQVFDIAPTITWSWNNMAEMNRQFATQMQAQMQALGVPYAAPGAMPGAAAQQSPTCRSGAMADAAQLLQQVGLGELRRGAKMLDGRRRPDLMAKAGQLPPSQRLPTGGEILNKNDIAEMLVGYSMQGQDFAEILRGHIIASQTTTPNPMGQGVPIVSGQSMGTVFALRAPNGQLDFELFDLMAASIDLDPRWLARVQGVTNNIAQVTQQEIAKRSRIVSEANADISRIIVQGYNERQRAQDRAAENYSNYIRGKEIYVDNRTGEQISLPSYYSHTWRLNDGSFVLTNDSNFDPNRDLRIGGYPLQVRPR